MGVELWRSDGTDEGTVLVKETHAGADSYISSDLVDVNGMIFFITYSPGSGYELWQSDGTEGGTVLIKGGFGWSSVDPKIAVDGVLFFRAGSALWRSDGTEAGTTLIRDGILAPEFGFTACGGSFAVVNGVLVFPGRDENGCELWRSDGVTAELLMDINPGPASSMRLNLTSPFTEASGLVLFAADDGVHGMELWATDGTSTTRMTKVFPGAGGSGARSFIRFGPQVFFTAFEPDSGGELWALSLSDPHQGLNLAETRANLDAPDQSRSRWPTSMGELRAFPPLKGDPRARVASEREKP